MRRVAALRDGQGAAKAVNHNRRMSARWWAFGVWALVAASAVGWALVLRAGPAARPAELPVAALPEAARGDLLRVVGHTPAVPVVSAQPQEAQRFELIGVVAPAASAAQREGLATIAVDGERPKTYRVGAIVDGETVLQAVERRGVSLGPRGGPSVVSLELEAPVLAATGTLPNAAPARPQRPAAATPDFGARVRRVGPAFRGAPPPPTPTQPVPDEGQPQEGEGDGLPPRGGDERAPTS